MHHLSSCTADKVKRARGAPRFAPSRGMDNARTNMPELLNRFMETSNLAIKPVKTRLHRLIILRFLYSFGESNDVQKCLAMLQDAGVDVGVYNQETTEVGDSEVRPTLHGAALWAALTRSNKTTDWAAAQPNEHADERMDRLDQTATY